MMFSGLWDVSLGKIYISTLLAVLNSRVAFRRDETALNSGSNVSSSLSVYSRSVLLNLAQRVAQRSSFENKRYQQETVDLDKVQVTTTVIQEVSLHLDVMWCMYPLT